MTEPIIRGLQEQDWPDALVLLEKVFGVGPWLFHSLHKGTTDRNLEHVSGAWLDGELVALVDVFLRDLRWFDGCPARVGCIGSVSTHPEYRRLGLSGKLIERSLRVMKATGCAWSLLFTGIHAHYERFGWRTQTQRHRVGALNPTPPPRPSNVARTTYFPLGATDPLVPWHAATNESRPLSMVRSTENWDYAARERLNRPGCTTLTTASAYAFTVASDSRLSVREVGGSPDDFPALAAEAHCLATERGIQEVELAIPLDPLFDGFAAAIGRDYRTDEGRWAMARPIDEAVIDPDLERLFEAPGAHHYSLDDF